MDRVLIRGLEVQAVIGVHGWERLAPRPLRLDLDLGTDIRAAAASDHLRDAVDYHAVCEAITAFARETQPQLLEAFAERLARLLFERYPLLSLRLTLHKPGAVPGTQSVGVEIERRREDYAVCGR
jgi:7,8-dihydroneopterin aldolase/epimerase/oxygenase